MDQNQDRTPLRQVAESATIGADWRTMGVREDERCETHQYTPGLGKGDDWRSDVDDSDETGYERGDVEWSDAVAQDAEALEERSRRSSV